MTVGQKEASSEDKFKSQPLQETWRSIVSVINDLIGRAQGLGDDVPHPRATRASGYVWEANVAIGRALTEPGVRSLRKRSGAAVRYLRTGEESRVGSETRVGTRDFEGLSDSASRAEKCGK